MSYNHNTNQHTSPVPTMREADDQDSHRQTQRLASVGQLAAGVAHEINTPTQFVGDNIRFLETAFSDLVRLLQAYEKLARECQAYELLHARLSLIDTLRSQVDAEYLLQEIPRAIYESLDGIRRVTEIVRALKEFAHPDASQKGLVDLNKVIQTAITVSRNEWKYVANVTTDLDPHLPPVACYQNDISQTVMNLIVNAADAIEDANRDDPGRKGTITITSRVDGDCVEIRVSDTGSGIPDDIHERIFEPFFTTKKAGEGTGLGLAIAYDAVVRKHKGSINFETEVGKGTTFIVRLPIQ
ncbi:MAG: sensor histidine kinase [Armatimonadota bacterium]